MSGDSIPIVAHCHEEEICSNDYRRENEKLKQEVEMLKLEIKRISKRSEPCVCCGSKDYALSFFIGFGSIYDGSPVCWDCCDVIDRAISQARIRNGVD